jgi:hypothetical protein
VGPERRETFADGWVSEGSVHAGGFEREEDSSFGKDFCFGILFDEVEDEEACESESESSELVFDSDSEPEELDSTSLVASWDVGPSSTKNS